MNINTVFNKDYNWRILELALKEMEKMSYDEFLKFLNRDCILFNLTCMEHNFCLAIKYRTITYYRRDEDEVKASFDISIFYKDKNDNLEFKSYISDSDICELFYNVKTESVEIKKETVLEKGVSFIVENIKIILEKFSKTNKLFRDFVNLKKYDCSSLSFILKQAYYGYLTEEDRGYVRLKFDDIFYDKIKEAKVVYSDILGLEEKINNKKIEIMKIMEQKYKVF